MTGKKLYAGLLAASIITAAAGSLPVRATESAAPYTREAYAMAQELVKSAFLLGEDPLAGEKTAPTEQGSPERTHPRTAGSCSYTKYLDFYENGRYEGRASLTAEFQYAFQGSGRGSGTKFLSARYEFSQGSYCKPEITQTPSSMGDSVTVTLTFLQDRGIEGIRNHSITITCDSQGKIT